MVSDELTLQLLDLGVIPAALAYLLLTASCGVLAVNYRSWAAWVATAGFGYMALSAVLQVGHIVFEWFAPYRTAAPEVLVTEVGMWLGLSRPVALLAAAAGLVVFAWQRRKQR